MFKAKQIFPLLGILSCSTLALAAPEVSCAGITYTTSAKAMVQSKSANVIINVSIFVKNSEFNKAKGLIDQAAKTLFEGGKPEINDFDIRQEPGGMIRVRAHISLRVPINDIEKVRANVEKLNKDGVSFQIESVDFSATQSEINEVESSLRNKIYQEVKQELKTILSNFGEDYRVSSIEFERIEVQNGRVLNPVVPMMKAMAQGNIAPENFDEPSLSQEIVLNARVNIKDALCFKSK